MKRCIISSDMMRFEYMIKRYDNDQPELEIISARSQAEAEDMLDHDEYIEWWDYNWDHERPKPFI